MDRKNRVTIREGLGGVTVWEVDCINITSSHVHVFLFNCFSGLFYYRGRFTSHCIG